MPRYDFSRIIDKISSLYEVRDFLSYLLDLSDIYPYQCLNDSAGWTCNVKETLKGARSKT